jgi:copper chaperone
VSNTPLVRVALNVPDISCDHCVRTVTGALRPLDGVEDVSVDLPARSVQIAYDPHRVTLDRIREVLADEAYPVASEGSTS